MRPTRLRLWWYNNIQRHWHNLILPLTPLYRQYVAEGRDPRFFPRAGRVTAETFEWAERVLQDRIRAVPLSERQKARIAAQRSAHK